MLNFCSRLSLADINNWISNILYRQKAVEADANSTDFGEIEEFEVGRESL